MASTCLAKTKGKRLATRDWKAVFVVGEAYCEENVVDGMLVDLTVGGPEIQEEGCTERCTMRGSLGD